MRTPESELKQQVIGLLIRLQYVIIRLNSGGSNHVPCTLWLAAPERDVFSKAGVFDLLVISPAGVYTWIDTKATRKPSPAQLEFKAAVEARGGACLFVKSLEELVEGLAL